MFHEEKGLAICGLACVLCSEETCPGCQRNGCKNRENCSVYTCASGKGLAGCCLCNDFPCGERALQSVRVRAFNRYAKENGVEKLMTKLRENSEAGITYHCSGGLKGDYDSLDGEDMVLNLIEYGRAMDPYDRCPVLETDRFMLRLVQVADADELLLCYSDPDAQRFLNADNCTSDFRYSTVPEMLACIGGWLRAYQAHDFVRWGIIDKRTSRAIGTIEMFGDKGKWGVLRVDLAADYETEAFLDELFGLAKEHFFKLFKVDKMLTKAVPAAIARTAALRKNGFMPAEFAGREHYYSLSQ